MSSTSASETSATTSDARSRPCRRPIEPPRPPSLSGSVRLPRVTWSAGARPAATPAAAMAKKPYASTRASSPAPRALPPGKLGGNGRGDPLDPRDREQEAGPPPGRGEEDRLGEQLPHQP